MISLPLLLATLLLAGPADEVARVGATVITRAEVEARLSQMRATGDQGGPLDAVNGLIGELLLEQEARRLGLAASPALKARVEQERRRLAGALLEERELAGNVKIGEADLRAAYHSTADSVRLDVLVFDSEHAAAAAVARAGKAGDLEASAPLAIRRLKGEAALRGQVDPKLVDLAFKAPIGAVQGPVEASVGWAVLKVLERQLGDEAGFQARRAALQSHAAKGAVAQARAHLVQQLKAQQKVQLDEAFLDALPKGSEATPAQAAHVLATVGGRPLTYGDILPTLKAIAGATGHSASATVKKQVAWQEAETRLLQDAAVRRGYADDPSIKAKLPAIEAAALVQALAGQLTSAVKPPTEQEIAAFHKARQAEINQPLDAARPAITTHLLNQRRAAAVLAKVRELRGKATVEVRQPAIDAIGRGP